MLVLKHVEFASQATSSRQQVTDKKRPCNNSFIYQQHKTILIALYCWYQANWYSQLGDGSEFVLFHCSQQPTQLGNTSLDTKWKLCVHTSKSTSIGSKDALPHLSCKSNCKMSNAKNAKKTPKPHMRAVQITFPVHGHGAGLGTRGPCRAPSEHATWQLRWSLHTDWPCRESPILEKHQCETLAKKISLY